MGFFGTVVAFAVGGACGVYAAQNYNLPSLRKMAESGCSVAKQLEQTYLKPLEPPKARLDTPVAEAPQIKDN